MVVRNVWNGARITIGVGLASAAWFVAPCHLAGCFYGLCLKLIGVHVAGIKRLQFL